MRVNSQHSGSFTVCQEKKQGRKRINAFQVAATYVGTVVGAGFASGQEILQFFGLWGGWGLPAIVLAVFLFAFLGWLILIVGSRLKADSHKEVIEYAGGRWLGRLTEGVITFFLLGAFTAMAAGAGAIFREQFGLPYLWGSLVLAVTTMLTVLMGISGVVTAVSFFAPLLLLSVVGIALFVLLSHTPVPVGVGGAIGVSSPPVPFWFLSALVYVSYNLALGVSVLAPLGREVEEQVVIRRGAWWGAAGLGLGAVAIYLTLLAYMPAAAGYEVPMIYITAQIAPWLPTFYSLVLLAEVYTTAVGSLYGLVERFTDQGRPAFKWVTIGATVISFAAGQLGFAVLVRTLYPAAGYAGLLFLSGLVYRYVREHYRGWLPRPAYTKEKP